MSVIPYLSLGSAPGPIPSIGGSPLFIVQCTGGLFVPDDWTTMRISGAVSEIGWKVTKPSGVETWTDDFTTDHFASGRYQNANPGSTFHPSLIVGEGLAFGDGGGGPGAAFSPNISFYDTEYDGSGSLSLEVWTKWSGLAVGPPIADPQFYTNPADPEGPGIVFPYGDDANQANFVPYVGWRDGGLPSGDNSLSFSFHLQVTLAQASPDFNSPYPTDTGVIHESVTGPGPSPSPGEPVDIAGECSSGEIHMVVRNDNTGTSTLTVDGVTTSWNFTW